MASRTLNQILKELSPTFKPQVESLQQRANLIPGQIKSEEQGLQAKQEQAFGDILGGARRRGLGFSGIPLGEQAKYTSTEFLPALARLRQSGRQEAMSLQDAILGVKERQGTLARDIYQREQDRAEQARQASLSRQAQASAMPTLGSFGSMFGGQEQTPITPQMQKRKGGGFNFQDAYGTPINAAEYVQLQNQMGNKITFRDLLSQMSKTDKGARTALQYVGDDFRFNPNAPQNLSSLFKALGVGGNFKQQTPKSEQDAIYNRYRQRW